MKEKEKELFQKIRKHLFDLHTAWENDPNMDGHCKSSEGYVEIVYAYPNWFDASDYLNGEPKVHCNVYSYLFGPSRMHEFDSLEKAWKEVQTWQYIPNEKDV